MSKKQRFVILGIVFIGIVACTMFFAGTAYSNRHISSANWGEILLVKLLLIVCVAFVVLLVYIIWQRRKNEKKLVALNQMYASLIKNIQGGVITCIYDVKAHSSETLYINDGWTQMTGYTLEGLNNELGGNPQALVIPEDREAANKDYAEQIAVGNSYKLQYRIKRKDNTVIWVIDRGITIVLENGCRQNQSIISEVTEIKEKEELMTKMAQTDQLTGLHNKISSTVLTEKILCQNSDKLHALMVLDVDDFKSINDSLGHIFGDTVLIEASTRLKQLFRNNDVIGRIGGDEFLILMTDIVSRETAEKKASEVCATFRNTYVGERGQYKISCSLGVAYSTDGTGYEDLFNKADIALYKAKTKGKDQYIVYAEDDCERTVSVGRIARTKKTDEKDSGGLEIKERFFELLYGSVDFSGSINMALALIGRIMNVGRVYVFENSQDNSMAKCTYEWCAEGIQYVGDKFQDLRIKEIGYLDLFDKNGILCCADVNEMPVGIKEPFIAQKVRSIMQVAIMENGIINGFIGFDDFWRSTSPTKENRDLMIFAAKVIGIFILKKRAEDKTELYNQKKLIGLDTLPNITYVIDDDYRLMYMNNKTIDFVPSAKLGDHCYEVFMKNSEPCDNCPGKKCSTSSESAVISSSNTNTRLIANASRINSDGNINMRLISCQDITDLN